MSELTSAVRLQARRQYLADGDAPFTSGNLATQRMDMIRLPLRELLRLDDGEHPFFLVGLSTIGGDEAVGP